MDDRLREGIPGSEAERRADRADEQPLAEQRRDQRPPRHAERAQQRELGAPPHDRERLRREHEQPAGEERHQREHVQVHAIGARDAGAALDVGLRPLDLHAGGQLARRGARAARRRRRRGARAGRCGSAGRGDRRPPGRRRCRRTPRGRWPPRTMPATRNVVSPSATCSRRRSPAATPSHSAAAGLRKIASGPQRVEGVGGVGRDELRLHEPRAEDVEPEHPEALAPPDDARVDLDHRARDGDLGQARDARRTRARRSPRAGRRSGDRHSPESVCTACVNSLIADWLTSCTAKPSATPSAIAASERTKRPLLCQSGPAKSGQRERGARHGLTPPAGPTRSERARGRRSAPPRASA